MPNANIRTNSITEKDTNQSVEVSKLSAIGVADGAVIYVDTVADLQALDTSGLVGGQQASVGEAGMFVWSGSEWLPKNSETITVRIPSDYPTLQEAIDTLSNFKPAQGVIIDLLIESGYELTAGLYISGGDFSQFKIRSEDSIVGLDQNFTPIPDLSNISYYNDAVFAFYDCMAPVFDIIVDADDQYGPGCSYFNSRGVINSSKGVRNAGTLGLALSRGALVNGGGCDFRGANWGSRVTTGSTLIAPLSNFSNAKNQNNPTITVAAMDVSRASTVYLTGNSSSLTDLTGSMGRGVAVRRSRFIGDFCDVSGAEDQGFVFGQASSGHISFSKATDTSGGLVVTLGGHVCAEGIDCSSTRGVGVNVTGSSTAQITNGIATNCTNDAIQVSSGSCVSAIGFNGTYAGDDGLQAQTGATITVHNSDFSGASNRGLIALTGAKVAATNSNFRKGGADSSSDVVCQTGAIITFNGGTGGTSINVNEISSSGIIFK